MMILLLGLHVSQQSRHSTFLNWKKALTALPSQNLGYVGVPSEDFIYNFADANENVTTWAVSFTISPDTNNAAITNYRYQLWHHSTLTARNYPVAGAPPFVPGTLEPVNDQVLSVVRALDEAISNS